MGMSAEVLSIGPFRTTLVPHLRHPPERYAATREGAVIVEVVVSYRHGNSVSRDLAACFGIDAWDFNAHAFDPWRTDIDALRRCVKHDGCPAHVPGERQPNCTACQSIDPVAKFLALRDAGHRFYFRPNG